eukprot:1008362-Pelagomonas_calceolata.AAC.2
MSGPCTLLVRLHSCACAGTRVYMPALVYVCLHPCVYACPHVHVLAPCDYARTRMHMPALVRTCLHSCACTCTRV